MLLHEFVRVYLYTISAHFAVHFLVNQLFYNFSRGLSVSDVVLHSLKLFQIGGSSLQEHGRVYIFQIQFV